jgi:hypothetical protein
MKDRDSFVGVGVGGVAAQGRRATRTALRSKAPPAVAYARLAIPPAVYEGVTHRDLSDMRIFNATARSCRNAFVPRTYENAPWRKCRCACFRSTSRAIAATWTALRSRSCECRGTTINVTSRDAVCLTGNGCSAAYVLDASEREDPIARADVRDAGHVGGDIDAHADRRERRPRHLAHAAVRCGRSCSSSKAGIASRATE